MAFTSPIKFKCHLSIDFFADEGQYRFLIWDWGKIDMDSRIYDFHHSKMTLEEMLRIVYQADVTLFQVVIKGRLKDLTSV